jgi:hypothetical protein
MAKAKNKAKLIVNIIVFSLVGAIAIFAVVTAFIKTSPAPKLDEPYAIQIISQGAIFSPTERLDLSQDNDHKDDLKKFYNTYNEATGFSALRGIMEYQWFKTAHITTYKDDDGKKQLKTLDKNDISEINVVPSSIENVSKYLIALRYNDVKTLKIDDEEIAYDTVLFVARYTKGEIASFKMYFVEFDRLQNEDFYTAFEITAYGQQTKLYVLIEDILK